MTAFDLEKLWTNPKLKMYSESKKGWGKLRVKKDSKTGKHYFDILLGIKGRHDWHSHIGITLSQKLLFKEFRDQIHEIARKDESLTKGVIFDKKVVIDPAKQPLIKFEFKPHLSGVTGEVTVLGFKVVDM